MHRDTTMREKCHFQLILFFCKLLLVNICFFVTFESDIHKQSEIRHFSAWSICFDMCFLESHEATLKQFHVYWGRRIVFGRIYVIVADGFVSKILRDTSVTSRTSNTECSYVCLCKRRGNAVFVLGEAALL